MQPAIFAVFLGIAVFSVYNGGIIDAEVVEVVTDIVIHNGKDVILKALTIRQNVISTISTAESSIFFVFDFFFFVFFLLFVRVWEGAPLLKWASSSFSLDEYMTSLSSLFSPVSLPWGLFDSAVT